MCEYTTNDIRCDSGLIQIIFASFGRHDNKTCSHMEMLSTSCHASNSQSVAEQICQGKKTCTVFVGLSTFGSDPCVGIYKYLDAEYNCIDPIKCKYLICQIPFMSRNIMSTVYNISLSYLVFPKISSTNLWAN